MKLQTSTPPLQTVLSRRLALVLPLLAVLPVTAAEQSEGDGKGGADAPQTVVIKGAVTDARREDVSTRIVVRQEELARFGDTVLTETLTRLPGITVTSTGAIAMRGLANGYVQILLNGEKMPNGFSLDTLAPELIERVEILRAGTADLGTQAIAGTINIILKKNVKTDQRELKAGLEGGHGVLAPTLNVQRSARSGALAYTLAGSLTARHAEPDWSEDEYGSDAHGVPNLMRHTARTADSKQVVLGFAPRLSYTLANGETVTLQTFLNGERVRRTDLSAAQTSLGPDPEHSSDWRHFASDNRLLRNDLSWQHRFDSGSKLDLKLGQTATRRDTEFRQIGYTSAGERNLDTVVDSEIREHGWTSTGKYASSLFTDHAIALGWDGGRTTRDETRVENALAFPGVPPINTDQRYSAAINRLALYAQDEWSPGAGLSLYLGVRWEGMETSSAGNEFARIRNRSSIFFPVLQSVWKIPGRQNDQVRVAVTRTYNPPEVVKLIPRRYTSLNNTGVYPDREGNPKLRPEVAMGLDAAFEHYWGEKAMVSVSAYAREIDDFIREDVSLVGNRWLATNINAGKAHTRGIEIETRFPLTSLFPTAPAVDLSANLTRNWSSVDDVLGPNNRLAQQTRLSGVLGADYRLPGGVGSAGASFRFKVGGPVRVAYNETEYSSVRRELDLYAVRKLGPKMQLRVTLLNLLHQPTWIDYGFTVADSSLNLVETRPTYTTLRANLEWQF